MIFKYKLSDKIQEFINNCELDEINIGCSDSQVIKVTKDDKTFFLKIASLGLLTSEYEKLKWLENRLSVPKIVLYDKNDTIEYLITESINGEMVCSDKYIINPILGLKVIAEAFNEISKVDISDCPFDVSINYKLNLVEKNIEDKLINISQISKKTLDRFGNLENILKYLKENKFDGNNCFSHGDTSLPNIFANNDKFSGLIDVGECGIADKWFDLAICEKSIRRNYGEEYISKFYELLNIVPDRRKIDYYLLIMELYL